MPNFDVLARVFSAESGEPERHVRSVLLFGFTKLEANMTGVHKELSDDEAERLLTNLRENRLGVLLRLLEDREEAVRSLLTEVLGRGRQ